jgi:hypothetical protein
MIITELIKIIVRLFLLFFLTIAINCTQSNAQNSKEILEYRSCEIADGQKIISFEVDGQLNSNPDMEKRLVSYMKEKLSLTDIETEFTNENRVRFVLKANSTPDIYNLRNILQSYGYDFEFTLVSMNGSLFDSAQSSENEIKKASEDSNEKKSSKTKTNDMKKYK